MTASPNAIPVARAESTARDKLVEFLDERRRATRPVDDLESFEQELHAVFAAAEAEAVAEELGRFDVDLPAVEIEGVVYRQVLRCEQTYMTAAGPATVMRSLYRTAGERTVSAMELRAGIVEGYWTPRAAQQAAWVVAHLVPQEGEELFGRMGGMSPSKSSLDRLPKLLSARWEEDRESFETALRAAAPVPAEAASVAISLDGVMTPMKDGERSEKRERAAEAGKQTRGPAGYQEVGCGTISLYDRDGNRLGTVRFARMPEAGKATLKGMLTEELAVVLAEARPDRRQAGRRREGQLDLLVLGADRHLGRRFLPCGRAARWRAGGRVRRGRPHRASALREAAPHSSSRQARCRQGHPGARSPA